MVGHAEVGALRDRWRLAESPAYKEAARYTHRQLATMIGSKRETVTKAFTLLQQAGIIELRRRRIHIKDIQALKRVADPGLHQTSSRRLL